MVLNPVAGTISVRRASDGGAVVLATGLQK